MMRDDESSETPAALEMTREEARATLERQLGTLDDIDTKAARILRLNVVVAGALLTVVSITVDADVRVSPLFNVYTVFGASALLGSTVFAALTYTVSDARAGLSATDIRGILAEEYDEDELLEGLVDGYADWIAFNHHENIRNTPLITATVLGLIYAVTGFFIGVVEAFAGPVSPAVAAAAAVGMVAMAVVTDLHGQIREWLDIV
jgi:hypothetical protein